MLYKILLSVITALLIFTNLNSGQTNNVNLTEKTLNDTLIELFLNCTCTLYSACDQTNVYMVAAQNIRSNSSKTALKCSNPDYICCINKENMRELDMSANNNSCGISKTQVNVRILTPEVESATTIPGEAPWMVEIFVKKTNAYEFQCAGTLIHSKVVLTATHCIVAPEKNGYTLKVLASGADEFENIGANPENERNVVKIIKHPGYNSRWLHNDISLLILEDDYSFTKNRLNSICLPTPNENFDSRRCIATGWGKNKELKSVPLRKVDLPIMSFQQCQNIIERALSHHRFKLHDSFSCAGGEKGKDTCKGDGGSPLVCLGEDYTFVQVGIVSWGLRKHCGLANEPGVYVNVAKFTNWIKERLQTESLTIN